MTLDWASILGQGLSQVGGPRCPERLHGMPCHRKQGHTGQHHGPLTRSGRHYVYAWGHDA